MKPPRKNAPASYNIMNIPLYGEVGAGRVIEFIPRHNQTVPVAIPTTMNELHVGTLIVRGCSLEDEGIFDGDLLIFNKQFTLRECMFETICVVFIIPTGELVAKKLRFADNGFVTLRASGGGVQDMHFHRDDIEVKGIAFGFQRMFNGSPGGGGAVDSLTWRL